MLSFFASTNNNLRQFIPAYAELTPLEKKRINEFSLVWQLFEGRIFNYRATGARILELGWFGEDAGAICEDSFASINYFRHRYALAEDAEARLNNLIAGPQGENVRQCIEQGLSAPATPPQIVGACAAICFRLRNNLFHGGKAAYGFAGQLENFSHGVRFLNACLRILN